MQKIYIGFSDNFVTEKLFNYLKNSFDNITLLDFYFSFTKESIVITDLNLFNENSVQLKDTNVILLLELEEKGSFLKNNLLSINTLDMPIKIQDLIDAIEQKKVSIANIYNFNKWYLDLNNNTLYNNDKFLNLSEKEVLILKEFFINNVENSNKSLTKEYFLKNVWHISNMEIESQSLESYISILRRKFNDSGIDLVITKNKDGYLLS